MKNSTKWRRVECFNKQTKHAIWLTSSFNEVLNIFLKFYSYHRNSLRQNEMVIIICLRPFFSHRTFLHPIVLCNLLRSCPHRFKSVYKLGWLQEAFRTHKNVLNQFHSSWLQSVCPWCYIFFYSLFAWVGSQQHEDPRVQWRKRRETMLCDYLVMVQSDLTVRKKICFSRVKNYWYESYLLVCSQNWTWPNTWAHKVITCNKRD